jgi:hypothetical protein
MSKALPKTEQVKNAVQSWAEAIEGRERGEVDEDEEKAAFAEALFSTLSDRAKARLLDTIVIAMDVRTKARFADIMRIVFRPQQKPDERSLG